LLKIAFLNGSKSSASMQLQRIPGPAKTGFVLLSSTLDRATADHPTFSNFFCLALIQNGFFVLQPAFGGGSSFSIQ
jgi:hypothetical protein